MANRQWQSKVSPRRYALGLAAALFSSPLLTVATAHATGLLDKVFENRSKSVLVFVDVSGSIAEEDKRIYRHAFAQLKAEIQPGDKVGLSPLWNDNMPDFDHFGRLVELDYTSKRIRDEKEKENKWAELEKTLERILSGSYSKTQREYTRILDALKIAGDEFATEHKRPIHWLVLLSDMEEDSPVKGTHSKIDFAAQKVDAATFDAIANARKKAETFPDLHEVRVYVAGVGTKDMSKFAEIESFWLKYFQAAGAVCQKGMYVRDGLSFDGSGQ